MGQLEDRTRIDHEPSQRDIFSVWKHDPQEGPTLEALRRYNRGEFVKELLHVPTLETREWNKDDVPLWDIHSDAEGIGGILGSMVKFPLDIILSPHNVFEKAQDWKEGILPSEEKVNTVVEGVSMILDFLPAAGKTIRALKKLGEAGSVGGRVPDGLIRTVEGIPIVSGKPPGPGTLMAAAKTDKGLYVGRTPYSDIIDEGEALHAAGMIDEPGRHYSGIGRGANSWVATDSDGNTRYLTERWEVNEFLANEDPATYSILQGNPEWSQFDYERALRTTLDEDAVREAMDDFDDFLDFDDLIDNSPELDFGEIQDSTMVRLRAISGDMFANEGDMLDSLATTTLPPGVSYDDFISSRLTEVEIGERDLSYVFENTRQSSYQPRSSHDPAELLRALEDPIVQAHAGFRTAIEEALEPRTQMDDLVESLRNMQGTIGSKKEEQWRQLLNKQWGSPWEIKSEIDPNSFMSITYDQQKQIPHVNLIQGYKGESGGYAGARERNLSKTDKLIGSEVFYELINKFHRTLLKGKEDAFGAYFANEKLGGVVGGEGKKKAPYMWDSKRGAYVLRSKENADRKLESLRKMIEREKKKTMELGELEGPSGAAERAKAMEILRRRD